MLHLISIGWTVLLVNYVIKSQFYKGILLKMIFFILSYASPHYSIIQIYLFLNIQSLEPMTQKTAGTSTIFVSKHGSYYLSLVYGLMKLFSLENVDFFLKLLRYSYLALVEPHSIRR